MENNFSRRVKLNKINLDYDKTVKIDGEDIQMRPRRAHSLGSNLGQLNSLLKSRSDYNSDGQIDHILSFFPNKERLQIHLKAEQQMRSHQRSSKRFINDIYHEQKNLE